MIKKQAITVIAGTLVLFLWNAISWMVLPLHSNTFKNIPDSVFEEEILQKTMPESGVYHYPGLPKNNSAESLLEVENKLKNNPRITLMVYKNEPTKLFDPSIFIMSFLINLATVLLTFYVVARIEQKSLGKILITTLTIGLISVLVGDLSQMNWYLFPLDYSLVNVFDKLISFSLLGILFGAYTFKGFEKTQ
ncbi:MAG: hypothetical protein MI810_21235 [Flavobacteriales bacterium]|nr:hypothetical protein [Flavobacteriales bacterium]